MKNHSIKKLVFSIVALFVLLACATPLLPSPVTSNPAPAPGSIETIVVATAGAAQTRTALARPSATHTPSPTFPPTQTRTETPTETATVIFFLPTATNQPTATQPFVTQSAGANCQIVAQSPVNNAAFASQEKFTVDWTLRNTGNDPWYRTEMDFFYSGGTDMHKTDVIDIPHDVGKNAEITFSVDMTAPKNAGTYTSTWSLGKKNNPVCKVSVTVIVK